MRNQFFVQKTPFDPPTMQFMLPEQPLPDSAEVAVLVGLHQVPACDRTCVRMGSLACVRVRAHVCALACLHERIAPARPLLFS